MVEQEEEATPGLEHPGDLVDGRLHRIEVLEHEAHHHCVERGRAARQRVGPRPRVAGPTGPFPGHLSWAAVGSSPTASAPSAASRRATWPSPQPTSSTRRHATEMALDDREDLLLVLGVGAVGELVAATSPRLPPTASRRSSRSLSPAARPHADSASSAPLIGPIQRQWTSRLPGVRSPVGLAGLPDRGRDRGEPRRCRPSRRLRRPTALRDALLGRPQPGGSAPRGGRRAGVRRARPGSHAGAART